MEVQQVKVGEVLLSVGVQKGDPAVLLLHGLAGHRGEWSAVIESLGPGCGIVSPDQRGHGDTWHLGTVEVDRTSYVRDAEELIERFADGPAVVVGQSMGGIVATLVAHRRPDLVSGLVLIEAGMSAVTPVDLAGLQAWFERWPAVFADKAEAVEFFGAEARSTKAWVDGLEEGPHGLSRRFDAGAMIETMRELALQTRWSEWKDVNAPTTLIRAERSFLHDDDVSRMLDLRPDTDLVVVPDSGHDVHLDQPVIVAAAIRRHLRHTSTQDGTTSARSTHIGPKH